MSPRMTATTPSCPQRQIPPVKPHSRERKHILDQEDLADSAAKKKPKTAEQKQAATTQQDLKFAYGCEMSLSEINATIYFKKSNGELAYYFCLAGTGQNAVAIRVTVSKDNEVRHEVMKQEKKGTKGTDGQPPNKDEREVQTMKHLQGLHGIVQLLDDGFAVRTKTSSDGKRSFLRHRVLFLQFCNRGSLRDWYKHLARSDPPNPDDAVSKTSASPSSTKPPATASRASASPVAASPVVCSPVATTSVASSSVATSLVASSSAAEESIAQSIHSVHDDSSLDASETASPAGSTLAAATGADLDSATNSDNESLLVESSNTGTDLEADPDYLSDSTQLESEPSSYPSMIDLETPSQGRKVISAELLQCLFFQMVKTMAAIHAKGVIHGDAHKGNWLLNVDDDLNHPLVYLADFGHALFTADYKGDDVPPGTYFSALKLERMTTRQLLAEDYRQICFIIRAFARYAKTGAIQSLLTDLKHYHYHENHEKVIWWMERYATNSVAEKAAAEYLETVGRRELEVCGIVRTQVASDQSSGEMEHLRLVGCYGRE